jgi:hypothetical protein
MTKEMFFKLSVVGIIVFIMVCYGGHKMSKKNRLLEEENNQMKRLLVGKR